VLGVTTAKARNSEGIGFAVRIDAVCTKVLESTSE
jgi:S1-C subfamily serine protease